MLSVRVPKMIFDLPANSAAKNEKDIHIVAISLCFFVIFIVIS